jgi:transcriptional pleiotropic regulator of transition state genes
MRLVATRKIDEVGRIVVPRELQREFQIEADTALDIYADDGRIVLQKSLPACKICGEKNNLTQMAGKCVFICAGCKQSIQEMKPS